MTGARGGGKVGTARAWNIESVSFLLFACAMGGLSVALLTTRHAYLALVPAVALLAFLYLGRATEVGFYFLVAYLPFQNYTTILDVGGYSFFTIQKVVGAWLVLVLVLSVLLNKRFTFNLRSSLWLLFAGFFVTGLFSFLLSEFRVVAANELRRQLLDIVYFGLSLVILSRPAVFEKKIPAVVVASVTASALLSIFGYVFNVQGLSLNVIQSANVMRGQGGAYDPNYFASIITFSIPFLMHWFLNTTRLLPRLGIMLLAGIGTVAIILTFSRGGFLIFIISLVLIAIEYVGRLRPRHLGFFTISIAAAIVGIALFVPRSYWERQRTTFSPAEVKSDIALSRRLSYLQVGWEEFLKHPVLGAGPGTFHELYGRTTIAQSFTDDESKLKRAAHNSYVHTIVGTGIVGFLFFVGMIVVGYRNFLRAERLFRAAGDHVMVSMTKAYKISYITLLITFFTLNAQDHKYFWLSLGFSQAAVFLAESRRGRAGQPAPAAAPSTNPPAEVPA